LNDARVQELESMSALAPLDVLGIVGSLRKASFNRALLSTARVLAPEGMRIEPFDIADIPVYNEDVLAEHGFPRAVDALRHRIRAADALIIATPEYNYSIPGVLKNAMDWVSRPPDQPFRQKPTSLMGPSIGLFGTTRAQHHLRQSLVFLDAYVLGQPEVTVAAAREKFTASGELHDETTRTFIVQHLAALDMWTRRLRAVAPKPKEL
jgi:chromate reductase